MDIAVFVPWAAHSQRSSSVETGLCHALSHLQGVDLAGRMEAITKHWFSHGFHLRHLVKIQLRSADVHGKVCKTGPQIRTMSAGWFEPGRGQMWRAMV